MLVSNIDSQESRLPLSPPTLQHAIPIMHLNLWWAQMYIGKSAELRIVKEGLDFPNLICWVA